jgi:hypothetical protein
VLLVTKLRGIDVRNNVLPAAYNLELDSGGGTNVLPRRFEKLMAPEAMAARALAAAPPRLIRVLDA